MFWVFSLKLNVCLLTNSEFGVFLFIYFFFILLKQNLLIQFCPINLVRYQTYGTKYINNICTSSIQAFNFVNFLIHKMLFSPQILDFLIKLCMQTTVFNIANNVTERDVIWGSEWIWKKEGKCFNRFLPGL